MPETQSNKSPDIRLRNRCQPLHYDLLVLCAAIEFADRRWKRPLGWTRPFRISIPVIDFASWQKAEVQERLRSVLQHLTRDSWHFDFVQAKNLSPIGERQRILPFENSETSIIAYSEGLDSRAVSALTGDDDHVLRIRVADHLQRRDVNEGYFTQIPFSVSGYRRNESSFRTRGFKFAAVTAIAAHISGLTHVIVPESGQGALGPVLLPLHNIYPDYRNHPSFFRKMEQFVVALLGCQIRYEQPRLWHTKGQTLQDYLNQQGRTEKELKGTRSCWQKRNTVNLDGGRKQCGLCAACLLRRLSLHAAKVTEASDAYVVSDLSPSDVNKALSGISLKTNRNNMIEYGSVGTRHLQHLANMADWPNASLRKHVYEIADATDDTYEETLKNLKTLLSIHADEWQSFLTAQGKQSFLRSWMDGGRNV